MESWQTDILAAVEAAGEGLASAQDQLATAYRLALHHTVLTAAPMSPNQTALPWLPSGQPGSVPQPLAKPGLPAAGGVDGLSLDLLYLLTCLELLKHAREAMASALESAWADETGSEAIPAGGGQSPASASWRIGNARPSGDAARIRRP